MFAAALAWGSEQFFLVSDFYGGLVGYVTVDGDGTLDPITNVENPSQLAWGSYGIGIGDFDNDGRDDYLIGGIDQTYSYLATIELHRKTGDGNQFAPGERIDAPSGWYYYVMDFAVADYDRDGNLDFAVNDYNNRSVHVYRGHGNGTFQRLATYPLEFWSIGMDSADVNNDGNPDFVANRYYDDSYYYYYDCYYYYYYYGYGDCTQSKKVAIFLGDGQGGFTQTTHELQYQAVPNDYYYYYYYYQDYSWGVAAADFDNDGRVDLAISNHMPISHGNNAVLVFKGLGDGTFQHEPIRTAPSLNEYYAYGSLDNDDLNHDGIQDLIYGDADTRTVRTYLGAGDGTFTLASTQTSSLNWISGVSARPGVDAHDSRAPIVTLDPVPALTNNRVLTITGNAVDAGGLADNSVLLFQNEVEVATLTPGAGGAVSATVTLAEGTNTFVIRATDRAGNVGESVRQSGVLDTHPPEVSLGGLPPFTTTPSFAVTGTVSDAYGIASVSFGLNGAQAATPTPDANGAVGTTLTLVTGTNKILLRAADRAGNVTNVEGRVILDTAGPEIALIALPQYTNVASHTLRGTVSDDNGVAELTVAINGATVGAPFSPAADGTFSVDVALAEGENRISVRAVDLAGLGGSAQATSLLDTVPPTATLAALPPYVNLTYLAIEGSAVDGTSGIDSTYISVATLGTRNAVTPDASGALATSLGFHEGKHTVVLEVRDRAGNLGATSFEFNVDITPPAIAVLSPAPGTPFATTQIPVAANVYDRSPTFVSVGGLGFHLGERGGDIAGTVELETEGQHTIGVLAHDAAGNTAFNQVQVVVDLTAPVGDVDFGGFANGAAIGPQPGNSLPYTLHVDDLTSVTATRSWDGGSLSFGAGGGVEQGLAAITEGRNVLSFRLEDSVGHETVVGKMFIYDVTGPAATLTGVLATGAPARGTVELSADAVDNLTGVAAATFDVDGTRTIASATGGGFVAAIETAALSDGPHAITATFTDGVGNTTAVERTLVVDNTAPVVALEAPAAGAYLAGKVAITAAASDATSGVAQLELAVNGTVIGTCALNPCTIELDTATLANGRFLIAATARDVAGNMSPATERTAIADNTAPSKFLVSPMAGATLARTMTVTVDVVDENFQAVECFVDGASLGASTDPKFSRVVDLMGKLDGAVMVTCSARDLAGNVGTESATIKLKNWSLWFTPRTLSLKSNGNWVKLEVRGDNVGLLLPVSNKALSLVVPGGSPVPVVTPRDGYQVETEDSVAKVKLDFDRGSLTAAIKAGIASGAIDPDAPLTIRFLSGNRELGSDVIRVQK